MNGARVNYGLWHARCLTCDAPTTLTLTSPLPARYTLADLDAADRAYICVNGHSHTEPARYAPGSYHTAKQDAL